MSNPPASVSPEKQAAINAAIAAAAEVDEHLHNIIVGLIAEQTAAAQRGNRTKMKEIGKRLNDYYDMQDANAEHIISLKDSSPNIQVLIHGFKALKAEIEHEQEFVQKAIEAVKIATLLAQIADELVKIAAMA